ncbi:AMP-binding protein [Halobaculum sp. WSA2]|uniref:AMP-binding protein n=1 Tax=Halobaculum saliterrae TaxID=2073113 RepID=A0A6B0SPQ6_9EURY|nr:AMP-binding protein [Halobaculum saliterrae]MXR40407.1 AMP-binding protein [Halobaculum saliterrae]
MSEGSGRQSGTTGGARPAGPDWVGDWSGRRAALSPERVGLVDGSSGREYTYAELNDRAVRTARLLRSADVGKGDRVVTLSRNRPALVDLFFATGKIGAVLAPLSHRLAPPEVSELVADTDPTAVVVEPGSADLVTDALSDADVDIDDTRVFVVGDDTGAVETAADDLDGEPFEEARSRVGTGRDTTENGATEADACPGEGDLDRPEVSLSDPHLFLHTGGSTGTPKQTVIPHRAVYWNSMTTIAAWNLRGDDVTPMPFPLFHTGGWNVLTVPLFHVGGTVVIAREFDPGRVLDVVDDREATVLVAVPAVLRMMSEHDAWADTDLSSLRFAKSGGGPCRRSVLETWWDRGVDLSQGYGLTECGPNNFAMPDDWPREKADAVGVPAPHVSARIVDADGEPVDRGAVGELELSSPAAADRYWNAPAETAETFGDGWVSTGDLARVDDDGYYHIEGRKKNMYVSGGENVFPAEIENALTDHPKVREAVVIGVPDDTWGTVGKAVVQGDDSLTLTELRAFLDGRLAGFKHPRHLAFVEEFPHSGPSKIDREAVRERFGGQR